MTDQPRYRIVCAQGASNPMPAEQAERYRELLDEQIHAHCGPHTVEPVEEENPHA